jgi:hypothetical protein
VFQGQQLDRYKLEINHPAEKITEPFDGMQCNYLDKRELNKEAYSVLNNV